MRSNWLTRLIHVMLLVIVVLLQQHQLPAVVHAQSDSGWSTPVKLNPDRLQIEAPEDIQEPVVVSDQGGGVHVFWRDAARDVTPAVEYAYLQENKWSLPTDILISVGETAMKRLNVSLEPPLLLTTWESNSSIQVALSDSLGHNLFQGLRDTLTIPIQKSLSGWGSYTHSGVVTQDGKTTVVYVDGAEGEEYWSLYYAEIVEGQDSEITIHKIADATLASGQSILLDPYLLYSDNTWHVFWTETQSPEGWPPLGIFYARSIDDGVTWSEPTLFAEGPYSLARAIMVGEQIHVVYYGTADARGRYHTWSGDGGRSWTTPQQILAPLWGFNGRPALAVDSANTLHLVTVSDGALAQQVFYSYWRDGVWSPAMMLDEREGNGWASLAVTNGNRLHVVWTHGPDVLYTSRQTDAPLVPSRALPFPSPTPPPTISPPPITLEQTETVTVSRPFTHAQFRSVAPPTEASMSAIPLVLGIFPSVALVLVVMFLLLLRSRRMS